MTLCKLKREVPMKADANLVDDKVDVDAVHKRSCCKGARFIALWWRYVCKCKVVREEDLRRRLQGPARVFPGACWRRRGAGPGDLEPGFR